MKTLVLIPTYNERDNLPVLVADVMKKLGAQEVNLQSVNTLRTAGGIGRVDAVFWVTPMAGSAGALHSTKLASGCRRRNSRKRDIAAGW